MDLDVIEEGRRFDFLWDVFGPFEDLLLLNKRLLQVLLDRQLACDYVFPQVGDIFLDVVNDFSLYEYYGENNEISAHELRQELRRNQRLRAFFDHVTRTYHRPDLQSYLTNIIKRLSDYKLVLADVLKRSAPDSPDIQLIPRAMDAIGEVGQRMNSAAKKTQIKRKMAYLLRRIAPGPKVSMLHLEDPGRDLIYETRMSVRGRNQDHPITLFLFDHFLVMAKTNEDLIKDDDEPEETAMTATNYAYQIYKEPIPLDLLTCTKGASQESIHRQGSMAIGPHAGTSASLSSSPGSSGAGAAAAASRVAFTVTIPDPRPASLGSVMAGAVVGAGTQGGVHHFVAANEAARDQWLKKITAQQRTRAAAFPLVARRIVPAAALPGSNPLYDALAANAAAESSPANMQAHAAAAAAAGAGASDDPARPVSAAVVGDRLVLAQTRAVLLGPAGSASNPSSFLSLALVLQDIAQIDTIPDLDLFLVLA
ncbi:RHO1 GDP-GTP exchange protein 2, partial [Cladochytrium tenue]